MGFRKVVIKQSAAEGIAAVAWYVESKGMVETAEKFVDSTYNFLEKLGDRRKAYSLCREPKRAALGLKCLPFKKKYIVVFIENDEEIIVCEFVPAKLIHW